MTAQCHLKTFGGIAEVQEYQSDKLGEYFTLTFKERNHGEVSIFVTEKQLKEIVSVVGRAVDELEMRKADDEVRQNINIFSSL